LNSVFVWYRELRRPRLVLSTSELRTQTSALIILDIIFNLIQSYIVYYWPTTVVYYSGIEHSIQRADSVWFTSLGFKLKFNHRGLTMSYDRNNIVFILNLLESLDNRLFLLSKFCKPFQRLGVIMLSLYMTFHEV
jgi:hypothetical protein